MLGFLDLPIVPILTLLVVVPLISWQAYNYTKEKAKNRKPNIPDINSKQTDTKHHGTVKNATLLTNLRPKTKAARKSPLILTAAVTAFVLVNLVIVTFYLQNRRLTYLPRATNPVTPTLITNLDPLEPSPTAKPTLLAANPSSVITPSAMPTVQPSFTPGPTISPSPMPTYSLTPASKTTPTGKPVSPTLKPTLVAYGGAASPTSIPTKAPTVKASPTTVTTGIPTAGIGWGSGLLLVLSLALLTVGFVL